MATKPTLLGYLRENLDDIGKKKTPGPYVTISRQYGCDGYALGDMLIGKFNDRQQQGQEHNWKVYNKEFLRQLAEDTGLTEEILEKEHKSKPSLFRDFLRGVRRGNIPDGYEIRNKITQMVRTVAFEGYAIIIGQGAAAATADLDNGISVRLEASKEWRIARVAARENLTRQAAIIRIDDVERHRMQLRRIYEKKNPRQPAFNLLIDNSAFNVDQVVDIIIYAMEQKGLVPKI